MDFAKELFLEIKLENIIDFASLIAVIIGGAFALYQWKKGNVFKRVEIVEKLISIVRTDEDIASILELIDWGKLYYDGDFYINNGMVNGGSNCAYDKDLFKKIDKTIAHFSYICYIKKQHILTKEDMKIFDYEIRRFVDNKDIGQPRKFCVKAISVSSK